MHIKNAFLTINSEILSPQVLHRGPGRHQQQERPVQGDRGVGGAAAKREEQGGGRHDEPRLQDMVRDRIFKFLLSLKFIFLQVP